MAQEANPYYQAARFPDKTAAGIVYYRVQQLIFYDVDCDLSAYRFKFNDTWHVVVIGEKPSDKLHVAIEAQLSNGTLITLHADVVHELLSRRVEAIQLGPWVEGHYSPPEE